MSPKIWRVLGLMSGSSLDGLDIAFCELHWQDAALAHWSIRHAETMPFTEEWQQVLRELPSANGHQLIATHARFGHYVGQLVNQFLQQYPEDPDFIASHGHTIFHFPDERTTLQIGDGAAIAATTGYPVINDFRAMDIALGGQGAPVAPIADRYLLPGYDFYLNLGGIANITAHTAQRYIAFDIGGANQVLNVLAQQLNLPYDAGGAIAASGQLNENLLTQANALPYHQLLYPKSLGNDWVQEQLIPVFIHFAASTADKLHTACIYTAVQIAAAIKLIIKQENLQQNHYKLLATGGGAHNQFLMQCIRQACAEVAPLEIVVPKPEIISFKEAALIALMGVLRLENMPNCIASVTGASRDAIGGAIHQGWRKVL
ncbi:MAG TPA: anhydro-N-acetylmuramic acid kinase [Saprospiraceae bacterium]|nr:anhydro-N-acetylmuramic acid kinase [Saprospiraceae bacterium]HMP22719.1 anhydro-N-acetylmuramic acid kinase [Saprospiraceae bacterium]